MEEIIKKSLAKPGLFADESVFIPNQKEIESFKEKQRKLMANEKPPQINEEGKEDKIKAIISVDNKD